MPLAQTHWAGLVNVPVGSTGFGFTLGSTTGANINRSERATGSPAKTNGSTGLSQSGFDNQRLFVNIYMLLPSSLVISSGMGTD